MERPEMAAYYGVMLASSGDSSRAAKFLDLGEKANLLPEERKLVEKAQLTVAQPLAFSFETTRVSAPRARLL